MYIIQCIDSSIFYIDMLPTHIILLEIILYFIYSKTQDKSNIFEDFLEYLKNRVIIKK